jgi:DNA-binding transcriptional ArsR family regulator
MKKQNNNRKALDFFKVLSHSLSDKILPLLSKKELPVTEIYNTLKIEQSQCSVHLSKLREHKIVTSRKDGKRVFYTVNHNTIEKANIASELLV